MILASNYIMLSGTYEIQLKIDALGIKVSRRVGESAPKCSDILGQMLGA